MTILVLDFPRLDRCRDHGAEISMAAAIQAVQQTGGRLAVVSSLPENMREELVEKLMQAGIAPLMGLRSALVAIEHAAQIGEKWRGEVPLPLKLPTHIQPAAVALLDEGQSKEILSQFGIETPRGGRVKTADEATRLAQEVGFPVVVKGVGSHLAHKTEQGAVKLNIKDEAAVHRAVEQLEKLQCDFLVEKMVEGGIAELLVGVARDPQFGLYLTIGGGGVLVELWQDVRQLLLPTTRDEIRRALLSLKIFPLLQGFRGRPPANIEAIIDVAEKIAKFALGHVDSLEELDINPLILTQSQAIAADALIGMRRS